MKTARFFILPLTVALVCTLSVAAQSSEFRKGQKAWSKHYETPLLVEPKPLAPVAATIGFAKKLSVREVRGTWLQVKSDGGEGWVFQGNVAFEKPSLAPGAGWTTIDASQTNTVAAARPLAPAAEGYAQRHSAVEARADIDWLDEQAGALTGNDIVAWMSAERLGEYQE